MIYCYIIEDIEKEKSLCISDLLGARAQPSYSQGYRLGQNSQKVQMRYEGILANFLATPCPSFPHA